MADNVGIISDAQQDAALQLYYTICFYVANVQGFRRKNCLRSVVENKLLFSLAVSSHL
jgi:hypothetical protein